MNFLQHRIQQIQEEMQKGQGGKTVYPFPIALEPPFEPFQNSSKPPSRLDTFLGAAKGDTLVQQVRIGPLSFIHIRPSKEDDKKIYDMAAMLTAIQLHSPASFEIVGSQGFISMQMAVHPQDLAGIIGILSSTYPHAEIFSSHEDLLQRYTGSPATIQNYRLAESHFFPLAIGLKRSDPYSILFGSLRGLGPDETGALQILFCQVRNDWRTNIINASRSEFDPTASPFFDLPDLPKMAAQKTAHPLFTCSVRVIGSSPDAVRGMEGFFNQFGGESRLVRSSANHPLSAAMNRTAHVTGLILNAEELSGLVHLPSPDALLPSVYQAKRTAPAPALAKDPHGIIFGRNTHRGASTPIAVGKDWLTRHIFCLGATGSGKTVFQAIFFQQFIQDHGAIYIDPSGDSAKTFLRLIPPDRAESAIYLDPYDAQYAPSFNVLDSANFGDSDLIRSFLITAFKRLFGEEGMGPRSTWLLDHALDTLLKSHHRPKTLLDLPRLFMDAGFRNRMLTSIPDHELSQFWKEHYPKLPESAILPLLNKVHVFLGHEKIRSMLGQSGSISLERVIRDKQILIISLPKGELGETVTTTLGFLFLAAIQQTILGLSRIPADKRDHFAVILDEAHLFLRGENTEAITSLLSESRKFKAIVVMGTQFIAQANRTVRDAILGNAGTLLSFRIGIDDAQLLQKEFGPFRADDLLNLSPGEALMRVGRSCDSFNLETPWIDLEELPEGEQARIIARSRERYYTKRELFRAIVPVPEKNTKQEDQLLVSIPPLSYDERKFLETIHSHPLSPVTGIYRHLSLSAYKGNRLKTELQEKGFIDCVSMDLSGAMRTVIVMIPTSRGLQALRHPSLSGKGSAVHQYFQHLIAAWTLAKGFHAAVEYSLPGGMGSIDVVAEGKGHRVAIELCCGSEPIREFENIRKCLESRFEKIISVYIDRSVMEDVKKRANGSLSEQERANIRFCLISDVEKCLEEMT